MEEPTAPGTNVRGRASHRRLLDAALERFGARGFRGSTLADIGAEAGVSEPAVLYHFRSKKELLDRVLSDHEAAQLERMNQVRADADGSLAAALLELAGRHEASPAFIRLFTVVAGESIDPDHPAHPYFVERYKRTRGSFSEWIALEQREGRVPEGIDPDALGRLLVAVLDGLELQYLLEPHDADIVGPLKEFFDFLQSCAGERGSTAKPLT